MQIFLLIVILILGVYVIYLHLRLVRKNILVESVIKKISGIEKDLSKEEINRIINELQGKNLKSTNIEDRLFEEKIMNFILENISRSKVYIHYTMYESVARTILSEGFKFADTFHKTALPVTNDKLDLMIKHNSKKYYGDYIIVINISEGIVKRYTSELEQAGIRNYSFENVLTEHPAEKNDNSDIVFLLPKQFIKGYINYRTGELTSNPLFNPEFSSPGFSGNIRRINETKTGH